MLSDPGQGRSVYMVTARAFPLEVTLTFRRNLSPLGGELSLHQVVMGCGVPPSSLCDSPSKRQSQCVGMAMPSQKPTQREVKHPG